MFEISHSLISNISNLMTDDIQFNQSPLERLLNMFLLFSKISKKLCEQESFSIERVIIRSNRFFL